MQGAARRSGTPRVEPASLFGVLHGREAGTWHACMFPGAWVHDASGDLIEGSLGMLADIAFSMPGFHAARDTRTVPVTSSLHLDLCAPLELDASPLRADAALVSGSRRRALSRGEIRDPEGTVVAIGSLQSAYVSSAVDIPRERESGPLLASASNPLTAHFPAPEPKQGASLLHLIPDEQLCNPRRELHGGVTATLADWTGAAALEGGRRAWALTSLGVDYLRPAPIGQLLTIEARCRFQGRSVAFVDVVFTCEDEAFASSSLAYARRPVRNRAVRE